MRITIHERKANSLDIAREFEAQNMALLTSRVYFIERKLDSILNMLNGDSNEAARLASNYAAKHVGHRMPQLEPLILTDAIASYKYAEKVIKGRWPEAEYLILNDWQATLAYASNVVKGPWK